MALSKIERAKYGPGMFEMFFGVLLSLLLGAVVAVVYLALEPAQIGAPDPKVEPVGPVAYIQGTNDEDRGKQWLRKKQLLTEGTSVEVNEDELNAWITAGTLPEPPKDADDKKPAPAAPGAKPTPPAPGTHPATAASAKPATTPTPAKSGAKPGPAAPVTKPAPSAPAAQADSAAPSQAGPLIQFGTPNFRIVNGVFQIASECQLDLDMIGFKRPIIFQASGHFSKTDGRFVFVPEQFYVGCCPLHKVPGVVAFVFDRVLAFAKNKVPEDIAAAWKKLTRVSIEGNTMTLLMP